MKTKVFLLISAMIFLFIPASAQESQEGLISDVKWQEKESLLTYNLSKEGLVKIRAGSFAGPVYRTIVNVEKRQPGKNQERWDGKDERGKIDFSKYGEIHFCVGITPKQNRDYLLNVKFNEKTDAWTITVDLEEKYRPMFLEGVAELRLYLDNKLIGIERVTALPHTLTMKTNDFTQGSHLLTLNLWQTIDYTCLAYNSLEIAIPEKESKAKLQKTKDIQNGKIAYCRQDKKGFWQILTSTLDGKRVKQLTFSAIDKRYPAWSPDGKKIAYVNNRGELWIIEANGRNNHQIPAPFNCSEPEFSPDGTKIIFTSQDNVYHGSTKIWQVGLKDSRLEKLVNRPWLQYNPGYSPDGKFIIFTDGPELFGQNILKLNLETKDITQITDNGPYDYDMQGAFLNSGQEIVYATNEGKSDYEIYRADKFGRNKINLSQNPQSSDIMPLVSKNGLKIFFLSDRSGTLQIWQMNIDGSEPKALTKGAAINSFSIYTES